MVISSLNFCSNCLSKTIFGSLPRERKSWSIYSPTPIHHSLRSISRSIDSGILACSGRGPRILSARENQKPSTESSKSFCRKLQDCKGMLSAQGHGKEHLFWYYRVGKHLGNIPSESLLFQIPFSQPSCCSTNPIYPSRHQCQEL